MFLKLLDVELSTISVMPFAAQIMYINIKRRADFKTGVYRCFSTDLCKICEEAQFGNACRTKPSRSDKDRIFYFLKKLEKAGLIKRTGDRHKGMVVEVLSISQPHFNQNSIPHQIHKKEGIISQDYENKESEKTNTYHKDNFQAVHAVHNENSHGLPDLYIDNIDNINKINKGEGFSEFESPKEQEEVHTLIQKWSEVLRQDTKVSSLNLKHFIKAIRFYGLDKCISILELVDSNKEHKLVKWIFERDPSNPYLLFGLKPIGFNSKSPAEMILSVNEEDKQVVRNTVRTVRNTVRTAPVTGIMKDFSELLDQKMATIPEQIKKRITEEQQRIWDIAENLNF